MPGRKPGAVPNFEKPWGLALGKELTEFLKKIRFGMGGLQGDPDTPSTIAAGSTADPGDSQAPAPSDHVHPVNTAAPSVNVSLSGPADEGTGAALMRADARLVLDDGGAAVGEVPIWDGAAWVPGPNGGGGGGNSWDGVVDFGASFTDKASVAIAAPWVSALNNPLSVMVLPKNGEDADELYLLDLRPQITDIVPGVGFTVTVYSEPEAKGDYYVVGLGA